MQYLSIVKKQRRRVFFTRRSNPSLYMRVIILLAVFLHVNAKSYCQTVSYTGNNVPLKSVFSAIKKQTGYHFFYSEDDLRKSKPVTLSLKDVPLETALKECLKGQPLGYSIKGNTIFIEGRSGNADLVIKPYMAAAGENIHGRVVNENGEPLAGVAVYAGPEGETIDTIGQSANAFKRYSTTVTNANGEFYLKNIDTNAFVTVSYLGYTLQQLKAAKDMGTIKMVPGVANLAAVNVIVNTGYQSISKERSAGSFSKPDMKVVADRSTSMNILQRLDGLIPGLTINNAPGATTYQVRGLTTINSGRDPLFVVDGVLMNDVTSVNPQDVADVTVLKDATAASIWGARAANGVIVITTKRGKPGEKIRIQYDGFVNFQGRPNLKYYPSTNSKEFIQTIKEIYTDSLFILYPWATVSSPTAGSAVPPHEQILYDKYRGLISQEQADKSLDSLAAIDNSGQIRDIWYRNAMLMNHTLSLSGGGKVHSFYGSLAYTNTQSATPGEANNTYKINLRQDFNFGKRIQAYLITDLTNTFTSAKRMVDPDSRFYPYL